MSRAELAQAIYISSHITGEFLLRSGATSNEYFDKYLFEAQPTILKAIAEHLAPLIPTETEVLAGLEMGGIPITTALSLYTGIPSAFVRKKAKDYGTRKISEGSSLSGKKVLIVEDVITSGGQVILSAKDMLEEGAIIIGCVCVINRESGGTSALAEQGITLSSLFTMSELKATAL